MTLEQNIHDFVDGILDPLNEDALFAALHLNEHLRKELKSLLLIHRSIASDSAAYIPSPQISEKLFNTLGFSDRSKTTKPINFSNIFSGIVGGIIGILLMIAFFEHGNFEYAQSSVLNKDTPYVIQPQANTHTPLLVATAPIQKYPLQSSQAYHSDSNNLQRNNRYSEKHRPSYKANIAYNEAFPKNKVSIQQDSSIVYPTVDTVLLQKLSIQEQASYSTSFPSYSQKNLLTISESDSISSSSSNGIPIRLEFRRIDSRPFESVPSALSTEPTTLLANSVISGYWALNSHQELGVEFGQEQSLQHYKSELNGREVEVIQNPIAPWGSIVFRQRLLDNQSAGINPYTQISIGATEFGPMARLMIAGEYIFLPELRMIFGGELSSLGYMESGVVYLAPRYGITYGLSGNF